MNISNIRLAISHILTVPDDMVDMLDFRLQDENSHECSSVGCIVGHTLILDSIEYIRKNHTYGDNIDFSSWSREFYATTVDEWEFLFDGMWRELGNQRLEAIARMEYVVEHRCIPPDFIGVEEEGYKLDQFHKSYIK